ncbi:SHC-transforming protein 4 [Acomys russatus]|uniref:SHC-transforming protein 4 n=1 Tax=Acomys russatus TaxID=60746 RepID=UPI0021E2F4C2|nr:SHC-transforming protein 4 [Acomys russatus]
MRERNQDSQAGLALYIGLFGHLGMLHRAKYSRFRNESITSLDEGSPGGSIGNKGSSPPPHPALAPHLPAEDATVPTQESPTALCTLIPRMASMKLANPVTFLSLKTFCLGTKEVPRLKLRENQDQAPSSPASPETSLNRTGPAPTPHPDQVGRRATPLSPDTCPLPGPGEPTPRSSKQARHPLQHLLGTGLNYCVRYMGCIEVLQSMRSLDFGMRTQVTREAISRLCEAVPGAHGAIKKRKAPVKFLSTVLGKSNLQFSGMNIKLTVSTCSLTLMNLDNQQIIANHQMQSISFASGGDPDTTDYVAYVAKDPVNQRACHILECHSGIAQDVISTIGQAFELRFKQYLKNPSLNTWESEEVHVDGAPEDRDHDYYNAIPGKQPPVGGISDVRVKAPATDQMGYCPIRCEKLCYLPGNSKCSGVYENCTEQSGPIGIPYETGMQNEGAASLKHSCRVDLFDDPCYVNTQALQSTRACGYAGRQSSTQPQGSPWHLQKAPETVQPGATTQPVSAHSLPHIRRQLWNEECFHGRLSRRAAEKLLVKDGDFLVRESVTSPGQYVLSGLQGGQAKHLLLVDPEGKVRTKDHVFDNVGHLIKYHMENHLPIISSGSEVSLKQPVRKDNNTRPLHSKK